MMPALHSMYERAPFDPEIPSSEFDGQWTVPGDVFSVLLLLGGDVVARALAQLSGSRLTPVAFSFGWVTYAIAAVVSAIGDCRLMPPPDCSCKVINGENGFCRDNTSWIVGRMVRDFEQWMDAGRSDGPIHQSLDRIIKEKWNFNKEKAEEKRPGSGDSVLKPKQAGLCVSLYNAEQARVGFPGSDWAYKFGFITVLVQLGIAAIPCGIYGDWSILLITGAGIILSLTTGSLRQWTSEKWSCRLQSDKTFVLTKGNGSQHAIVIFGNKKGLDLEDLATGPLSLEAGTSSAARIFLIVLAVLWVLLLVTAAGIKKNTWFLLAVGGIGSLQNIYVAGSFRYPCQFGCPISFLCVIAEKEVMTTLEAVEKKFPGVGSSMLQTFMPGRLKPEEKIQWKAYRDKADALAKQKKLDAKQKKLDNAKQKELDSLDIQAGGGLKS